MASGIDPKVDYAFKYLFGQEANKPLLIALIDSVLQPPPGREIASIQILNPFNAKLSPEDKLSILDIKAEDQSGRQFDVEMQMLAQRSYDRRIVYYAADFHRRQLVEGEAYDDVGQTISISFLDHVMFPHSKDVHLHFQLLEKTHHFPLSDSLEFHLFQLPLFGKSADQLSGPLDDWLYFLRHGATMNASDAPALGKPGLVRALEGLKMLSQTRIEQEQYLDRVKGLRDYATNLIGRNKILEEGRRTSEIRSIHRIERLLNRPETHPDQLARLSLDELERLQEALLAELGSPK